MKDLRAIGQEALNSINRLGASDVGDLVLGISDLIEELCDTPEADREVKIEHLRGLFHEFAYGEEYELRDERLTPLQLDPSLAPNNIPSGYGGYGGYGVLSGVMPAVSGALQPIVASGSCNPAIPLQNIPQSSVSSNPRGEQPLEDTSFDDDADYDDDDTWDEEEDDIHDAPCADEVEAVKRPWWKPEIEIKW